MFYRNIDPTLDDLTVISKHGSIMFYRNIDPTLED